MEILRDFTIEFNIDTGKVEYENISFYNTDKNMSALFLKLLYKNEDGITEKLKVIDAKKHRLELYVENSNNEQGTISGVLQEESESDSEAIFRFNLNSRFTAKAGPCKAILLDTFTDNEIEKVATSDSFKYTVKENPIVIAPPSDVNVSVSYDNITGELSIVSKTTYDNETGELIIEGDEA